MDDFEKAILCCFNQSLSAELRKSAEEFCSKITSSPEGWKICLEAFFKSNTVEVKFYCLQQIQDLINFK
jgi:hypothetical protein